MHRRSNLQSKQLAGSDSIYSYQIPENGVICEPNNIPSSMRPFSNKFCSSYPYNNDLPFSVVNNVPETTENFLGNGCHCAGNPVLNPDTVFVDSFIRNGVPSRSKDRSYAQIVAGPGGRLTELPNYYTPYITKHIIPPSFMEGGFERGGMTTRNDFQTVWTQDF